MAIVTDGPPQTPGRWSKIAPLLGLLFVVLVLASVIITNTPNTSNSPASILSYYQGHHHRVTIGALLVAPAVIVGLGWFAYLRNWLQRGDVHERWGALTFTGGILFAVTGGAAGGVLLALSDTPKNLTPSTAAALNFLQGSLPGILASMALGVMAISAGIAMVKSNALPTWLGWFSVVIGILGALPGGDFVALPAIGIWTLILVAVMWFRSDPEGRLAA
jgi:nucleoside recognition membrane protein YjiH